MKPVFQATVDREKGDCFSACLASILEIPLHFVPNFRAENPGGGDNMLGPARAWLAKHFRLSLVTIQMETELVKGSDIRLIGGVQGTYVIANYLSPNFENCLHSVVGIIDSAGRNIEVIHDPNPTGNPIEGRPMFVDFLVPLYPEVTVMAARDNETMADFMERTAVEVDKWPAWKKEGWGCLDIPTHEGEFLE